MSEPWWDEAERLQWFNGAGGGVRSTALYGVTRVHLRDPARPRLTRCGLAVPPASKGLPNPDPLGANDCLRCKRAARR